MKALLKFCWTLLLLAIAAGAFYLYAPQDWRAVVKLPPRENQALIAKGSLPPLPGDGAVAPAPEPLSEDPNAPWRKYAAPFEAKAGAALIVLTVSGLGRDEALSQAAIDNLPSGVSLSFSPYGEEQWITAARAKGHEALLDLPSEGASTSAADLGPQGLTTALTEEQNLARLAELLGEGREVVGFAALGGEKFLAARDLIRAVMSDLKARGLAFLDNGLGGDVPSATATALGVAYSKAGQILNLEAGSLAVQLAELERSAITNGKAVAIAPASTQMLEELANWSASLEERGFQLAPVTALIGQE